MLVVVVDDQSAQVDDEEELVVFLLETLFQSSHEELVLEALAGVVEAFLTV